ncbi:sugar ABC transporter substrate-binding protein [uncultured Alsobacter sp.]|uniref:ABC transporter substrate-binding protein n=1 Tax=uncultured Alsobacter sp. TaxID=1748258 RepID=UPI0025EA74BD|nr:sugar ABC transporter substrate-binding protein [uncultured Alsobacter sp.]
MSGRVTRRELLAAGGGLALAGLSRPSLAQAAPFDWKKHAGTTLRVITLKFPLAEIQQKRIADFQQLTGIKVDWEALPEDLMRQKIKVEHLGGATDLDVYMSYYGQEGQQFLASGWYTDTVPLIKNPQLTNPDFQWDDFIPAVRDGATVNGQVPIIPDRAQALPILYFRRDLFDQFKLAKPKTWDDVRNAAKVIHEGTNKQVFGIVLRGKGAAATSMLGPVLYDFGGRWADRSSGDIAFNTPEAVAAFDWWGSMLRLYGPPGSVNNHWAEVTSIFSQGRAAMVYDDITFATLFSDPAKSTVAGKVGYAAAPTGPKSEAWRSEPPIAPNSTGLAISGFSKKKEAAWLLVQYLSDRTSSQRYMLQGGLGARQSAWTDPEVAKALDPEFLETGRLSTQINAPGAAPHSIANVSKARDFIGEAVVASILGQDVKAALKTAADRCSELLKEERAKK